jgi:hypothetical protein
MSEIDEQAAELARIKTPSGVADRGVTKAKPVRPAPGRQNLYIRPILVNSVG